MSSIDLDQNYRATLVAAPIHSPRGMRNLTGQDESQFRKSEEKWILVIFLKGDAYNDPSSKYYHTEELSPDV